VTALAQVRQSLGGNSGCAAAMSRQAWGMVRKGLGTVTAFADDARDADIALF
jgi:hypothetical protein